MKMMMMMINKHKKLEMWQTLRLRRVSVRVHKTNGKLLQRRIERVKMLAHSGISYAALGWALKGHQQFSSNLFPYSPW